MTITLDQILAEYRRRYPDGPGPLPYNSVPEQLSRLQKDEAARKARKEKAFLHLIPSGFFFLLFLLAATNWPAPFFGVGLLLSMLVFLFAGFRFYSDAIQSRPRGHLQCPRCNETSSLAAKWVCGSCKKEHDPTVLFPLSTPTFVNVCDNDAGHCHRQPHSLWCRGCNTPIIFNFENFKRMPEEVSYLSRYPPKAAPPGEDDFKKKLGAILK